MSCFFERVANSIGYCDLYNVLSNSSNQDLHSNIRVTVGWLGGCRVSLAPCPLRCQGADHSIHMDQLIRKLDEIHQCQRKTLLSHPIPQTTLFLIPLYKTLQKRASQAVASSSIWKIVTFVRQWIQIHILKFNAEKIVSDFQEDFTLGAVVRDYSQEALKVEPDQKSRASNHSLSLFSPETNFQHLCQAIIIDKNLGYESEQKESAEEMFARLKDRLSRDITKLKSMGCDFAKAYLCYLEMMSYKSDIYNSTFMNFFIEHFPLGVDRKAFWDPDTRFVREIYIKSLIKNKTIADRRDDTIVRMTLLEDIVRWAKELGWSQQEIDAYSNRQLQFSPRGD